MPCSVSGVTTEPSEIPISTKIARVTKVGTSSGRPASEAAATARIEPDSQPAGNPVSPSAVPPLTAKASVSARRRRVPRRSVVGGTDKFQSQVQDRGWQLVVLVDFGRVLAAILAGINAGRAALRQTRVEELKNTGISVVYLIRRVSRRATPKSV